MSLLGIDVGTTGCKSTLYRVDGTLLASAYAEYAIQFPGPGHAVLDATAVWGHVQRTIREVVAASGADPVQAIGLSSLGEAVVPVSRDGRVLGSSILCMDARGAEYVPELRAALPPPEALYRLTGLALAGDLGLPKLMWIRRHQSDLYERTWRFLPWTSFVAFMLGAEPAVDGSLASRMLCCDIDRAQWSDEILRVAGLDTDRLPPIRPAGTVVGQVSTEAARMLGLPAGALIVNGCHDQCATAVGCGVVAPGLSTCGMGTFFCLAPVFETRRPAEPMLRAGLGTEPHAVPGQFVTLIYNAGGVLLRWYRDTFAAAEHAAAQAAGRDIYPELLAEMPAEPAGVLVLPHFTPTGPPEFVTDTRGVMVGLRLSTPRGEILRGILESTVFYLRECVDALPEAGITVREFRAAGGGSRSEAWLQICADILGRPFTRVRQTEAAGLGAALLAGVGAGVYRSFEEAVAAAVRCERVFEPRTEMVRRYVPQYERYRRLWPLLRGYLGELAGYRTTRNLGAG